MLPDDIQAAGKVSVGTEALYPPFEQFAADNKTIEGLDPDLGKALGEVLGIEVEFTHTAFDGLLTALDGDRFDLVIAGITDTKEREAKYDFVNYFMTGQSIVVKKGNPSGIHGIADLCGKPVAVLKASTQEKLLGEFNQEECASDPITIGSFPSDRDALVQVQTGRSEAAFTQDAVGRLQRQEHRRRHPVRDRQLRGPAPRPGRHGLRQGGHPAARRLPGCAERGHRQRRLRGDSRQVGHEHGQLRGRHHQRG